MSRIPVETGRRLSENLNRGSVSRRCFPWDPEIVDWSVPIDDRHLYMPETHSILYETPHWSRLSLAEKSFFTRWELTQFFRNNSVGEQMLNQAILAVLYKTDPYDPAYRYLLHEVAEECQHMAMFNQWIRHNSDIRTRGIGQEKIGPFLSVLTPIFATRFPPLLWTLTILFEIFGDLLARAAVHEPNPHLHPTVKGILKAHVIEEARHVAFANDWLENHVPKMSRPGRRALQLISEQTLATVLRLGFPFLPIVYSSQLKPYIGYQAFQQCLKTDHRRKLLEMQVDAMVQPLRRIGLVREKTLRHWERRGLRRPAPG